MDASLNTASTSAGTLKTTLDTRPEPEGLSQETDDWDLPIRSCEPLGKRVRRPPLCVDHRATVNQVTVGCLKELRAPQTTKKPPPYDLSLFPEMHIDILLEVLGHLHPLDLMHVARTNKAFRHLLLSPLTTPLWRAAFVGRPPMPECPSEICGRRWSKLLFGARVCDECGKADVAPDYRIWRRLCSSCMGWFLYNGVPTYSYSHEVNTLLARTYRTDGSSSAAESDVGRLWPADGTAVATVYERLKAADAEAGDDGLKALPAFIEERKKIVQAVEERAAETDAWSDQVCNSVIKVYNAQKGRVYKSARKRLREEGHDPRDIAAMAEPSLELEGFPRLTSKRWNKARPYVVALVHVARDERLQAARDALIIARRASAMSAISYALRTAPQATWAYNPPSYTLETLPPLPALIHDPSDEPLADDDPRLLDAMLGLPAFVEAWRAEKRALLASLLPAPSPPSPSPSAACGSGSDADAPAPAPDAELWRLDLATSIYTCLGSWVGRMNVTAGRALIGWVGAGAHLRCRSLQRYWTKRVHFAEEGAKAAEALVRLVGLDPERTTAVEMDAACAGWGGSRGQGLTREDGIEKRFLCALCPSETKGGVTGHRAMRWRECVAHTIGAVRRGDAMHRIPPPAWKLLTDAAVVEVRRWELELPRPEPVEDDSAWVCLLCTSHFEARVSRPAVIEHLIEKHGVREIEEGRHFLYFEGSERTPRIPALVPAVGDIPEIRCNHCPQGKLRSLRAIGRHIVDKHGVETPREGKDWTKVALILRATMDLERPAAPSA
ncbi:hypothetical protein C8R46DRAFT_294544 [Mycena filopes]|nr:hypothetical protein C8R46DRAFT_294544 [Mycena filopes]